MSLADKLKGMKNGYDQFFKNARKAASQTGNVTKPSHFRLTEEDIEKQLKHRMGMKSKPKKKSKKPIPWTLVAISFAGILAAIWGIENYSDIENYIKRVEVSFLGSALAEEPPEKSKKETQKTSEKVVSKDGDKENNADSKVEPTDDSFDHFTKLNERKKELDDREEELNRLDQELQTQKAELDKRLKELEDVRRGISSVLEDKVKVDDKKVDTLVLMYSDMKPPQAAKVFETMDEDLAVEILGRMKKKSAADIMNLLKPEKAQVLSEKFAGYKRK